MASKRQEFYMSVKAILDKTQAKKDAAELQELLSQTKIDFDTPEFESKVRAVVQKMSKETMSVIGQSFNEALRLLGTEQINIDSLIQMPNADMWTEMGKMAGRFYGEGLQEAVKKALEGIDLSALNGQKKTHGWIKNLGEIDQALSRLKDKKGNISQTKAKKIQEGFSPKPRKQEEALYTQIEKFQKSYSDKDEWEVRYANLVEYIKLYESYQEKFKNVPKELASIGKFTYKQVKSIEPQLQTSLQNIFNVAAGKQPIGLTEGGAVDVNVIPRVIETLDVYDILGGKDKIKVPVEVKVENEPKKSRMTPNALRGVQSPEETAGNRLSSREYLGGTYWVPNAFKDIAKNYGDGGNVLKAALKPLNELIVSVDGLEFKDLDKNQLLSYLFPGFDKYEQGGQQGDAPQKFFNEMARQAGFDSLVVKEVNEGGNELVDTIAVLQERITHYTEAIPEYYDVEKLAPDQERVVLSQQKGSAERWYDETINRLHQERDVAYANRDDIKEENKVKMIDSIIPMLEQMKTKAMAAFDQAIQPLGGYLEEEVKRGLPKVIKDVDDGRKVALIQEDTLKSYLSEYSELSSKKTRTKAENARINDINNAITSVVSESDIDNVYDYLDALSEGAKTIDEVFDFFAPRISFKPNNFVNSVTEPNILGTGQPSDDNNVNKTIQSYEELCEVVKRYNELVLKGKTEGQTLTDTDREELDGLTNRIQATRDLIASDDIVNEINAFDQTLNALGTTTPEKLAHYLGIEIPEAARKARDSIEDVNESAEKNKQLDSRSLLPNANNFEKGTRSPSDTQKEQILQLGEEYRAIISLLQKDDSELDGLSNALRERARAILTVLRDIAPSDISYPDAFHSIYGASSDLSEVIGNLQNAGNVAPNTFDSSKIDNLARQNAINLIYKEITATKALEEAKKSERAAERQAETQEKLDTFASKYATATEQEKELINELIGLWNDYKVRSDPKNGYSDQSLEAIVHTRQEKLNELRAVNESLWDAFTDIGANRASDYIKSNSNQSTSSAEPRTSTSDTTTVGKVAIDETALKGILDSITYKVQVVSDNESSEQGTTTISEESLKTILSSVTFNVQGSSEASTEEANKVAIDETSLENVLNKVFGSILTSHDASTKGDNAGAPQAQSTEKVDESSPQAPWARESTLSGEIKSTLEDIRKNTILDENNKPETSLGEDTVTRLTDAISQINITSDLTTEGLATQDTVSEISGLVKSINDKIVQGTKVIEKGKSTSVGDSKNTQKHNSTINHGQAEGTSGSAQKMFDYYYWLEEQMEKFKNNTKYYNALKSVRDRITPKIVKFNDELEISGKESPVWKKSLDQKHDLHMAQIQGGEEYSESLSTEKKALELLKEEYRLKSEIFNLEQQGAVKEDLNPLYEKLGIYQSIRNIIEDDMDDEALTRYAVQAAAVQGKGEDKLTVANIKSNIKARAEEVKQAAQSVKEEEQQEATALKELKKLYSELGVLQAKKQASDKGSAVATELRAQISAKKSEIAAKQVDHNVNQQLLEDERQLSYEKEKSSIAMQNAASKDATATKEEATALKELKKLYETLGKQKAIMDAATPGAQYDKAKSDYDKTVADIQNIPKASNFEAEDEIDIYNKAYEEQKRVLENEKKIQDEKQKTNDTLKQTKQALEEIKKLYAELGKWQAILDTSYDDSYVAQDAQLNIDRLKEEIAAKKEKVDISEEELQQIYQIAKAEKQRAITSQQSKQGDKSALKQQIKQSRENARFNRASSVWNAGVSTMESLWKIDDDSIDISQINVVRQLNDALNALKVTRDKVAQQGSTINPNDEALLKAQTQDVARLSAQVKELIQNYEQLSGENSIEIGKLGTGDLRDQLIAAVQEFTHGKAVIGDFDATTGRLEYTVKTGAHEFTKYTAAVRDADGSLRAMQGTTKRTETFFEASARKMKEISSYVTGMGLISRGMQEIRQGITYVREIDSALTELKKVTDETEESYDRFLQTASKTAAKVGSTVKDVVSSTADWARLGYSMEEAASLAESTSVLLNVSEFSSIDDATSALVSTMQAFGYAAKDSMHVVDVMNEIGNNYAVSSDGIATALQDSASSLMAANNSYQEAVALIASANKVVQDPSSVGSALRTISLRLRGTSAKELEEAGESSDGAIVSKSKLRGKIKSLSGVDILTDTGAYKSTYKILLEISRVWKDMSDIDQAALLEIIAGKFCQCVWKHAHRTHLNPVIPKALLLQYG